MPQAPKNRPFSQIWLPVILIASFLVLRVLHQHHLTNFMPNFSPLLAFAFTGTALFARPVPWWSWALLLLAVDWFSGGADWWSRANGHPEVLASYACYALAAFFGSCLRGWAGVVELLAGTLACSMLFYLVTNTVSWWSDPAYTKDFAGWIQSLTTGTGAPGLPPTVMFLRNSLIADLAGSLGLLLIYNSEASLRKLPTFPWFASRRLAA